MISLKTKTNKKSNYKSKEGFTLFVAMIVASLLLAVGFSISNIILKQLLLSGSGKDSQIAFYAADSGEECAQFWDSKDSTGALLSVDGPFATSTTLNTSNVTCGFGTVSASKTFMDNSATSSLVVNYSTSGYKACARVMIEKGLTTISSGESVPFTRITSRGYNSSATTPIAGGFDCDTSDSRIVERGVIVQY